MKQEEARALSDQELENVSGGMTSDNPDGAKDTCHWCGKPVYECTCTKPHLIYSPTQTMQA